MSLVDDLKSDLKTAMKSRDQLRVKTIRSLISAIDNATAIPIEPGPYEVKTGLNHDVERASVSPEQMQELVVAERDDLLRSASEYRQLGLDPEADDLETRAAIAAGYVL